MTRQLVVALTGAAVFLLATTGFASNPALPEVMLVVDTSQSMQYKVGADVAPDCSLTTPEKSRWISVREMLAGTFAAYTCKAEALPVHPDQLVPPVQKVGSPTCIPGVQHTLSDPWTAKPVAQYGQPVGDFSWKKNGHFSNLAEVKLQASEFDTIIPYFAYDLSDVPTGDDWVAARLELITHSPPKVTSLEAYVVGYDYAPNSKTPAEFVCDVDGQGINPVTPPTKVALTTGGLTAFTLNKTEVDKLKAAKKAGKKAFYFALVPVDGLMASDCKSRNHKGADFEITFEGPATSQRPKLIVEVGKACPAEGPGAHYAPAGLQDMDGILDVFGPTAKFAFMTVDNVMSSSPAATGGYTYGSSIGSLWGEIGVGLQSPFHASSASFPIPRKDDLGARAAAYLEITKTLPGIRPNGGTPLGQMLQDVAAYVGPGKFADSHFQTVGDDPINGDPFFQCRTRMVVVLTDGGANLADGQNDGRADAIQAANALQAAGVGVHVIAVGHPEKTAGAGPAKDDLDFLDDLANAGGTGSAAVANTPKELVDYLKPILQASAAVGEVLTRAHYTEATGRAEENMHSFHAKSVFNVADPLLSKGVIEERVFECGGGCADPKDPSRGGVCTVIDFAEKMKNRAVSRRQYTVVGGDRVDIAAAYVTADDMNISKTGLAPKLIPDAISGSCSTQSGTFDLSNSGERDQYRDHLLTLLRGDTGSCRESSRLGAPAKAQPVVLAPASGLGLRDAPFLNYKNTKVSNTRPFSLGNPPGSFERPTMLFAATHDGMLHAFRTDNDPNIDVKDQLTAGDEMWAWLPAFNLRRARQLRLVSEADASYLGAAVIAGHVMLDRPVAAVADQALRWRAVVIAGAGEAGAGYTAVDVTAPDNPSLLWEISPDRHCWGDSKVGASQGPVCVLVNTFEEMGRSTALPVIANLYYTKNSTTIQRAVAIVAGGKPPNDSQLQNFGVDGTGKRVVYVVALENGELIRKFDIDDMDMTGMTAGVGDKVKQLGYFYTQPTCFNNAPGQLVTRCFLGDSKGMVWRLDLSAADPAQWKLEFFHDAYSGSDAAAQFTLGIDHAGRAPVLSPPGVAMGRSGELVVVYGTGDIDDETSVTHQHLVYSVRESYSLSAAGLAARAVSAHNWGVPMGDNSRFVGPPLIFSGNAYWASYTVATSGACDLGVAQIWGVDFANVGQPANASNAPRDPVGAFDFTGPTAQKLDLRTSQIVGQHKPSPVDVAPVPACVGGCAPGDPNCYVGKQSALSSAKPRFEVRVGVAGTTQSKNQTPPKGAAPTVGTVSRTISAPRGTAIVTGWDLLLD